MAFEKSCFIKPRGEFDPKCPSYAPMFRKRFTVNSIPQKATLSVAGLGYGVYFLNEKSVTEDMFISPVSDYRKTVWYTTYDVTDKLSVGENVFAVMLGNGWYNEAVASAWNYNEAQWRDVPKFILSLDFDGEEVLVSDDSWKYSLNSPVTYNQLRQGEHFDARLYDKTWKSLLYDDSSWEYAKIDDNKPQGKLRECTCEPVREIEELSPVAIKKVGVDRYVYDFGRNVSGYVRIKIKQNSGDRVILRYAEQVHEDFTLRLNDMDNPHYYETEEFQRDEFICSDVEFVWSPKFTYHGFRYVEAIGLSEENAVSQTLTCVVVHQAVKVRSTFKCSNEVMNKLFLLGQRATLSNMFYMPTDCPTREKLGWMNDSHSSMDQFITDFTLEGVMAKWWVDICDAMTKEGMLPGIVPTPKWGYHWGNGPVSEGTLFEIPYRIYLHTGDDTLLKKGLPYFKRNLSYLNSRKNENGDVLYGLDDWAAPCPESEKVNTAFINRALIIKCLGITLLAAEKAGEDTASIKAEYDAAVTEIKSKYLNADGTCNYDKQTAVAMMIYFDLYDDITPLAAQLKRLVEEKNFHHECGMVGLRYLYIALNKAGLQEYAYRIINAEGFPSYRAWVDDGATTLYEYWDMTTSKNHHMYSDFMSWMIKTVIGINPLLCAPGFKKIEINPYFFEELDFAEGYSDTVNGKISVKWERREGSIILKIDVPAGVEASYKGNSLAVGMNEIKLG